MTILVLFCTACAIFACIAVVSAVLARRWASDALYSEQRLLRQRGDLVALETAVDAFDKKLRVLNGRMSAAKRWESDNLAREVALMAANVEPCPNWRTPQFPEGDDCAYCTNMRAEREAALAHARHNGGTLAALRVK